MPSTDAVPITPHRVAFGVHIEKKEDPSFQSEDPGTIRWRVPTELPGYFLLAGYCHLQCGSPRMFRIEEVRANGLVIGLLAHFTNRFDAYFLLDKVFSCGCEFIAFTTQNIFTTFDNMFPTHEGMLTLPYIFLEDEA
ncbi:Auxin-induced protein 5NG4 [Hordeum vulgare]|nr:Auxin-induced protein 5NG4 [Hordeum vulgare]